MLLMTGKKSIHVLRGRQISYKTNELLTGRKSIKAWKSKQDKIDTHDILIES